MKTQDGRTLVKGDTIYKVSEGKVHEYELLDWWPWDLAVNGSHYFGYRKEALKQAKRDLEYELEEARRTIERVSPLLSAIKEEV